MILVDTSAFYALLDADDAYHTLAAELWEKERPREGSLVTTNYVVLESMTLFQSRFGMSAVRTFRDLVLPVIHQEWIDEDTHSRAVTALAAGDRRGPGLVDFSSFEVMRRLGIRTAFTFDRHFRQYGFETVP
jgi:predicted nucleic acid-binding protein